VSWLERLIGKAAYANRPGGPERPNPDVGYIFLPILSAGCALSVVVAPIALANYFFRGDRK